MASDLNKNNVVQFPSAAREENSGRRLIPSRLLDARLAERLNQTELAAKVGVSRQAISAYEMGEKTPDPATMRKVAQELKQPIAYFTKPDLPSFGEFSTNFFRKVGADTKRRNLACEVHAKWFAQTVRIFEPYANFPAVDLPRYEPETDSISTYDLEKIEEIAEDVRAHFGLGLGPISNVVRLLEAKGVFVCRAQMPGENVEAFSFWNGSRPFVFLASDKESSARARFDAAHELGHLVLHRWVGTDEIEDKDRLKEIEREADRFAAAFLLPRKAFPNEVYSPRLNSFLDLKLRWKVSIQAMIYRCKTLGIFDEDQITNLYKQVSFKKWRKDEPFDGANGLPIEQPIILKKIFELVSSSGKMAVDEFSNTLSLSDRLAEQMIGVPPGTLALGGTVQDFEPSLK